MSEFYRGVEFMYVGVPCDGGRVAEIEALCGWRLPRSYRRFLMECGGGIVADGCDFVEARGCGEPEPVELRWFWGSGVLGNGEDIDLLEVLDRVRIEGLVPDGVLVIGLSDCSREVVLNFEVKGFRRGAVLLWDYDADCFLSLAPSFGSLLRRLKSRRMRKLAEPYSDDAYVLRSLERAEVGVFSPWLVRGAQAVGCEWVPDALRGFVVEFLALPLGKRPKGVEWDPNRDGEEGWNLRDRPGDFVLLDCVFWLMQNLADFHSLKDFEGKYHDFDRPCFDAAMGCRDVVGGVPFSFCGYAGGYFEEWWDSRLENGFIVQDERGCFVMVDEHVGRVVEVLRSHDEGLLEKYFTVTPEIRERY